MMMMMLWPLHQLLHTLERTIVPRTIILYRFEAASIQDMVTKFEPNLGFEKSFISVLALKVIFCSHLGSEILIDELLKNRAELQRMRTFYKLDFDADMDEEVLRWVDFLAMPPELNWFWQYKKECPFNIISHSWSLRCQTKWHVAATSKMKIWSLSKDETTKK